MIHIKVTHWYHTATQQYDSVIVVSCILRYVARYTYWNPEESQRMQFTLLLRAIKVLGILFKNN